jgi:hypothetical protein
MQDQKKEGKDVIDEKKDEQLGAPLMKLHIDDDDEQFET